jgi:hypothetical protein
MVAISEGEWKERVESKGKVSGKEVWGLGICDCEIGEKERKIEERVGCICIPNTFH